MTEPIQIAEVVGPKPGSFVSAVDGALATTPVSETGCVDVIALDRHDLKQGTWMGRYGVN